MAATRRIFSKIHYPGFCWLGSSPEARLVPQRTSTRSNAMQRALTSRKQAVVDLAKDPSASILLNQN
jgi:hypothetical protein